MSAGAKNTRHYAPSSDLTILLLMTRIGWIYPDTTGKFLKQSQLEASANALGNNFLVPDAELQGWLLQKKGGMFPVTTPNLRTIRFPTPDTICMFTPSPISMCATPPGMRTPPNADVPHSTRSKSNPVKFTNDLHEASTHSHAPEPENVAQ